MLGLFKKKVQLSKEEIFWNYFITNKKSLEDFIDSDLSDYRPYNKITKKMHKYSSIIFPEITKYSNGKYVLVITPDGNTNGIAPTENLFNAQPEIDNWIIEKFRQPKDDFSEFEYNGLKYSSQDIKIRSEYDSMTEKMNIKVHLKHLNDDEATYKTITWIYLDNILGEFNSISKLGYVDFFNLEEGQKLEDSISILELRHQIDKEIYNVK